MSSSTSLYTKGPPYLPPTAPVGGEPTLKVDVPILTVFIVLYLISFLSNLALLRRNRKRGHNFIISLFLAWFSAARIATCVLRIAWAAVKTNVSLIIAAEILVNAGILIIYIVNLELAKRILRAKRPGVGWHSLLRRAFSAIFALIAVALVLVIIFTIISFYTLNTKTRSVAGWIQRAAITYLLVVAFLPIPLLFISHVVPESSKRQDFGRGSMKSKIFILTISTCLCTTIAGFKAGTAWETPRPVNQPAWYDSKAAFYCFGFPLELIILYMFLFTRVDQRFHVPDGNRKLRSYSRAG
ncbi:hypothetical protein M433DRAFT_83110, partial [Acidomyces richmondensis BFW]